MQISELYAPLVFLLEQLHTIVTVKENIERRNNAEGLGAIAYHDYFLPIHEEIISILKTKIHLLEGGDIPPSVKDYIAHFMSERLAWRWAEEKKEGVQIWDSITGFPTGFLDQLKKERELAYRRYKDAVRELRHGAFVKQRLRNSISALFPRPFRRFIASLTLADS